MRVIITDNHDDVSDLQIFQFYICDENSLFKTDENQHHYEIS